MDGANIITPDKNRDRYDKEVFLRAGRQGEWLAPSMFTSTTDLIESKIGEGRRACPLPINGRNASGISARIKEPQLRPVPAEATSTVVLQADQGRGARI